MQKLIIFFILFLPLISGICNETQIDINNASLGELDALYGIGLVKAQEIINSRPFETLEKLLNVTGIGQITFEKIIEQNLACVNNLIEEEIPKEEQEEQEELNETENISSKKEIINFSSPSKQIIQETIHLNPKTIKTENSKETIKEKSYAKYSIIIFCILLLFLYTIKPRKKKNEWQ